MARAREEKQGARKNLGQREKKRGHVNEGFFLSRSHHDVKTKTSSSHLERHVQRLKQAPGRDAQQKRAEQGLEEEGRVVLRGQGGGEDFDLFLFMLGEIDSTSSPRQRIVFDALSFSTAIPRSRSASIAFQTQQGERKNRQSPRRGRGRPRRGRCCRCDRRCCCSPGNDGALSPQPSSSTVKGERCGEGFAAPSTGRTPAGSTSCGTWKAS